MKNKRDIETTDFKKNGETDQPTDSPCTKSFERDKKDLLPPDSVRIRNYSDPSLAAQIVRINQLTKMLSISRSCIYDWLNPSSPRHDPSFPKQIRLTGRARGGAVGWRLESIIAWIDGRR